MTRPLSLFLLLAALLLVPLSHFVVSGPPATTPPGKTEICHFGAGETEGTVIEVSNAALAAHLNKHGDCTPFFTNADGSCRCLTCQEQCLARLEICRAGCDPTDPDCPDACRAAAARCLRGCIVVPPQPPKPPRG